MPSPDDHPPVANHRKWVRRALRVLKLFLWFGE